MSRLKRTANVLLLTLVLSMLSGFATRGEAQAALPDLARLFDQIGYAHLTENGTLRIGNAFVP